MKYCLKYLAYLKFQKIKMGFSLKINHSINIVVITIVFEEK